MRKSNGELWEKTTAGLWVDAPMDALRDAFAAAVRADEAEHVRQEDAPVLKPCPFCGINASITFKKGKWAARCRGCGMGGRGFTTHADAAAAWNRRA